MTKKEKYQSYFHALLDELREQHNFTRACRAQGCHYHRFASGFTGIQYYAKFNQGRAYTALHINFGDYEENKNFFDVLKERESVINANFGVTLYWDRRDDIKTCKIGFGFGRDGDIESDTRTLEAIRAWHVENLRKFKEVFTPEIQRARETLQSREEEPE